MAGAGGGEGGGTGVEEAKVASLSVLFDVLHLQGVFKKMIIMDHMTIYI